MKYKLIQNSNKGVLIDRTPIMQDVRETYKIGFEIVDGGAYIALFRGADGIEYRKTIINGECKVPHELLGREQFVELTVHKIDGDKLLHSWHCEPLKITAFMHLRRTQWEVSGGMTDKDCLKRLAELEEANAQVNIRIEELMQTISAIEQRLAELEKEEELL